MSRCVKNSSELKELPAYQIEYEGVAPDCNGYGIVLRHKKSGARVCLVSNDDENKVFAIGFRTPPTDSTGVAHIIEHTVLCGSDKFPVKDPFAELMKGSLNTFLNAMTFPDKTCYPVASCNDADFANLMDVYMDAVLHPNIYKEEKIFKQEGWHYELESKDDPLTINGIVYSEMKGAYSSPDSRLEDGISQSLNPDNTYGHDSGGNPKNIPELTYENYLDFHRKYYHPTNSYILLYGNVDIEERLEWLDTAYLSEYDVQPVDSEIKFQKPVGLLDKHEYYPAGDEDPIEDASYLAWAFSSGSYKDRLDNGALSVIGDVLFNAPGAPIKEALIKANIGQDVYCDIDDSRVQPIGSVVVRNTNPEQMPQFKKIIMEELEKAAREGLNKESLLATVNRVEFSYCEADYGRTPKGLAYGVSIMSSWLYDDAIALEPLNTRKVLAELREKINTDYYENLIKTAMLDSASQLFLTLEPKRGMGAAEEKELEEKLAELKASLSDEELDKLVAETADLKAYQAEPSTPEELLTIPQLRREDISREAAPIICADDEIMGIPVKYHEIETNGILYLKLLFDMDKVPEELIPYAGLSTKLFGNMNTRFHSYLELDNLINIHTGGISTDVSADQLFGATDEYRPFYVIGGRAMSHEVDNLLDLIIEEVLDTDFDSVERVRELLAEKKARMQGYYQNAAVRMAIGRAQASINSVQWFRELANGFEQYNFICKLIESSDDEIRDAIEKVKKVCSIVFGKDNLILDVICNKELYEEYKTKSGDFTGKFTMVRDGDYKAPRRGISFKHDKLFNEGFKMAGDVNYLVLSGKYSSCDSKTSGRMSLVSSILSSDYLWNNIRVLGGAYGCGFSSTSLGCTGTFHSYRDPHLSETLEVYKNAVKYLREFTADERQMTKYIIGTIGNMDTPLTPAAKGDRGLALTLSGVSWEHVQGVRDAILAATEDDIRAAADIIEEILSMNNICAVGCERSITENAEMFNVVRNLI